MKENPRAIAQNPRKTVQRLNKDPNLQNPPKKMRGAIFPRGRADGAPPPPSPRVPRVHTRNLSSIGRCAGPAAWWGLAWRCCAGPGVALRWLPGCRPGAARCASGAGPLPARCPGGAALPGRHGAGAACSTWNTVTATGPRCSPPARQRFTWNTVTWRGAFHVEHCCCHGAPGSRGLPGVPRGLCFTWNSADA